MPFATCRLFVVGFLLASLALPLAAQAQEGDAAKDAAAKIEQAVRQEIEADLFPGAVVLLGTADRILFHDAYGLAQVKPQPVAMRKDSIFDVASVTKIICTATAMGILRDRGLIDPDAPMSRYLPDHKGKGVDQISPRHLAAHVSGFAADPRVSHGGKVTGDEIFVRMLLEDPTWPVNTKYEYADRNIILLSTIIERVTGKSFEAFCQEEVFRPLQMKDSHLNRVEPTERVVDCGYPPLGLSHNIDTRHTDRAIGSCGLFTTAEDVSHVCRMMLHPGEWEGRRVLSKETVIDFTTRRKDFPLAGRGFIWEVDEKSNHRPAGMSAKAYGHSGWTGISVWIDPVPGVYTIVMTNRTHPALKKYEPGQRPSSSQRTEEQYRARGRIAQTMLDAFGY